MAFGSQTYKGETEIAIRSGNGSGLLADVETKSGGKKGLHVISTIDVSTVGAVPTVGSDLRYVDMNASNGGVARATSIGTGAFVDVFSKSGTGLLFGFIMTLESGNTLWNIRLVIDGIDIFMGATGFLTTDLDGTTLYNVDTTSLASTMPLTDVSLQNDTFRYQAPLGFPIRFTSSVVIKVKRTTTAKLFRAGFVTISGV